MAAMNIQFTDEANAALERLAAELGTSKAGVLRFGLSLLSIARTEAERGNALGVINGDRVVKEIAGVWIAPRA